MDDASYFLVIRLGPKTSECEKNVFVVSTATSCDVTNCATTIHGFNKHFKKKTLFARLRERRGPEEEEEGPKLGEGRRGASGEEGSGR